MKHMWSEEEISSQKKDIATLVDSKGNPRFIEGEGTPASVTGLTTTYCKWSLSGTHLMLAFAGTIANGTVITNGTQIANFMIPNYILEKIYPVFSDVIEVKGVTVYASNWSSQSLQIKEKRGSYGIMLETGDLTLTAERNFRVQFDLLIDSE